VNYGYNLTYPSNSKKNSSNNPLGSILTSRFNILSSSPFDRVKLSYYYTSTIGGYRNFTYYFPIHYVNNSITNNTIAGKKDNPTYGMGLLERIIIVTLIVLIFLGISALMGQPLAGLLIGGFVFSYFVYIQFIPIWAVLPTFVIGLILLSNRSSGY
jgi:hypothetical protein